MQELPKLQRNYSSGAIIWGSVHPTEENILLLKNIDMYNYTAVNCLRAKQRELKFVVFLVVLVVHFSESSAKKWKQY